MIIKQLVDSETSGGKQPAQHQTGTSVRPKCSARPEFPPSEERRRRISRASVEAGVGGEEAGYKGKKGVHRSLCGYAFSLA